MPPVPDQPTAMPPPTAFRFLCVCLLIGLLSFGGGLTAWVHREVVLRRGWMNDDEFLNGVALGQVLPGANVTNLIVYIGHHLLGPLGAVVGLVGLLAAPFLAVIALGSVYQSISGLVWLHQALDGIAAAAIGLLLVVATRGARHAVQARTVQAWSSGLVLAATVIGIGVLQWPLLLVVLCLTPVSVALAWMQAPE